MLEAQIVEVTHKGDAQEVEAKIAEATHKGDAQEVEVPSSAMLQAQTADTVVEAVLEAQTAHTVLDTVPAAQIAEANTDDVLSLSQALIVQEPSCSRVLARKATVVLRVHKTPKNGTYNIIESRSGGVILVHLTVSRQELIRNIEHFDKLFPLHGFEKVYHVFPGFQWDKWALGESANHRFMIRYPPCS